MLVIRNTAPAWADFIMLLEFAGKVARLRESSLGCNLLDQVVRCEEGAHSLQALRANPGMRRNTKHFAKIAPKLAFSHAAAPRQQGDTKVRLLGSSLPVRNVIEFTMHRGGQVCVIHTNVLLYFLKI
jgi:hypothetical protein